MKKLKRIFYMLFNRAGENLSINDNRMYGKFRVKYPDGLISQPFFYNVAKTYKNLFGGEIIDNF